MLKRRCCAFALACCLLFSFAFVPASAASTEKGVLETVAYATGPQEGLYPGLWMTPGDPSTTTLPSFDLVTSGSVPWSFFRYNNTYPTTGTAVAVNRYLSISYSIQGTYFGNNGSPFTFPWDNPSDLTPARAFEFSNLDSSPVGMMSFVLTYPASSSGSSSSHASLFLAACTATASGGNTMYYNGTQATYSLSSTTPLGVLCSIYVGSDLRYSGIVGNASGSVPVSVDLPNCSDTDAVTVVYSVYYTSGDTLHGIPLTLYQKYKPYGYMNRQIQLSFANETTISGLTRYVGPPPGVETPGPDPTPTPSESLPPVDPTDPPGPTDPPWQELENSLASVEETLNDLGVTMNEYHEETLKAVQEAADQAHADHEEAEQTRKGILQAILDLPKTLLDGFIGLFVPTEEQVQEVQEKFNSLLENKLGLGYQASELVATLFTGVVDALTSPDPYSFVFPEVSFVLPGANGTEDKTISLIEETPISLDNALMDILRPAASSIVLIVCGLAFVNAMKRFLDAFVSGKKVSDGE